ncbi:hypothetical protein AS156_29400 [Bradyrhizobium macuxiense]|uniref:Uncharacterized protein n=1 Tax=Bradyrhizobium macuxiense TaxID=1755647 RepID=A0A109K4A2_9BRAD|nr:hypothetical protein [Bradyrhizobium macuxiense]KWV60495.1 hypothetical protein AS156_29400 [Bradyrhizobium macuxiense]
MSTPAALLVKAELDTLRENVGLMNWSLEQIDDLTFVLGLPAKDGVNCHLRVRCDGYAAMPPAWHWFNPATGRIDYRQDTPRGGNFLHGNGVICAPWNRLAYTTVDSRGPHSDWEIGAWQLNPYTKACRNLSAMALRIAYELMKNYDGRLAA